MKMYGTDDTGASLKLLCKISFENSKHCQLTLCNIKSTIYFQAAKASKHQYKTAQLGRTTTSLQSYITYKYARLTLT